MWTLSSTLIRKDDRVFDALAPHVAGAFLCASRLVVAVTV
jgi:hypothetical protein